MSLNYVQNHGGPFQVTLGQQPIKVALERSPNSGTHRELAMRVHQLALEKMEEGLKNGPSPMSVLPYAQIAQSTGVQFHLLA